MSDSNTMNLQPGLLYRFAGFFLPNLFKHISLMLTSTQDPFGGAHTMLLFDEVAVCSEQRPSGTD